MDDFKNGVNLVLAADDNYAQHLGVTLISIVENYNDPRFLFFHILDNGINENNKKYLEMIISVKGVKILFYKISEELLTECPEVNHLSKASCSRLLISELLPLEISKILYLDSDIVVLGNIAELYDQNLSNYSLGAVEDVMAKEILRIYFYPSLSNYFNAGVLLINLDSWRLKNIKNRSWQFINKYFNDIVRLDQDILNCLFKDDWQQLDDRFNLDLKRKSFKAMPDSNTLVLHYSDKIKPWQYNYYRLSSRYYFFYLNKTPWRDFKFSNNNFFKKYCYLIVRESKRILLPYIPLILLDKYRCLLWRTYKVKK